MRFIDLLEALERGHIRRWGWGWGRVPRRDQSCSRKSRNLSETRDTWRKVQPLSKWVTEGGREPSSSPTRTNPIRKALSPQDPERMHMHPVKKKKQVCFSSPCAWAAMGDVIRLRGDIGAESSKVNDERSQPHRYLSW